MLSEQQLEILSDAIRPLFQHLEQEVILDIARRVQKTMTYTRTAELMAMDMQKLGYSPNKIRAEVMKVLRADKAYMKTVEDNTIAYKKEVKELIDRIVKSAAEMGDEIIANAGKMSWVDDMSVWESAGRELTDNSFLHDLQKAIAEQTIEEMVNLTRTTGFKTMSGFESIGNAYRRELDKAMIKLCTGTFSQEKVLNDVIHNLAQSGLRSVDYASGYTMQLDTAVKNALRTGCGQISAKIMDENLVRSGENLVYVSSHWGARNKGIGVENHELWQGKVYFVKPGKDYSEEAKRIGQDRIMDIWYSTGYSPDGSHVNNPLGLHGYNCRHSHRVWFEGASSLPQEQPELAPVTINGKTYDYYQMTQKMRSMERNIRALKKELVARESLKLPRTEIKAKIQQKTREYEEFCRKCKVPERTTNLRVDGSAVDVTKTRAYKNYTEFIKGLEDDKGFFEKIKGLFGGKRENVIIEFEKILPTIKNEDVRILLQQAKERTSFIALDKHKSMYEEGAHTVYYGKNATPGTIAHELFHEIYDTYRFVEDDFLSRSVKNDFSKLTNLAKGYGKSIEEMLYLRYPNAFYINDDGKIVVYEKYRGLSDIIHGASDGKIDLGYGHRRQGYWSQNKRLEKETFAQFGRMLWEQDEDVLKVLGEVLEDTNREVLGRLKGMIK